MWPAIAFNRALQAPIARNAGSHTLRSSDKPRAGAVLAGARAAVPASPDAARAERRPGSRARWVTPAGWASRAAPRPPQDDARARREAHDCPGSRRPGQTSRPDPPAHPNAERTQDDAVPADNDAPWAAFRRSAAARGADRDRSVTGTAAERVQAARASRNGNACALSCPTAGSRNGAPPANSG